jgi:putative PIN family toxin of toxin-antitoxin system
VPLRVVLDTNIQIAARHRPDGRYATLWHAARERRYTLLFSPALASELGDVLRRDFGWDDNRIQSELRAIARVAEVVQPRIKLQVVTADPDDDRVLECAVAGNADLIVSNDRHLRNLGSFRDIAIVTGADFRRILGV